MIKPELKNIDDYRRLSTQLLHHIQRLRESTRVLHMDEAEVRLAEIQSRAQEDTFRVAVVGEFKRGKSTLINALLGREILPADVLPCSATLNRVTYGLKPLVKIRFKADGAGARKEEQIDIDALSDYVTKLSPESKRRAADVEEAVVYYPVRYCRDKADIIDTPGLNDDAHMTQVTFSVLPHVDAVLLVILAQSPFSSYESQFLDQLMSHDLGRVLFVVNRMDDIRRPKDRERILALVRERIINSIQKRAEDLYGDNPTEKQEFINKVGEPRIFGVSGGMALEGKLEDDASLLEESQFPVFEKALEHFLTVERGAVTLRVMSHTTLGVAAQLKQQISIRKGAMTMKQQAFEEAYKDHTSTLEQLRVALREELRRLDKAEQDLTRRLLPHAERLPRLLSEAASAVIAEYKLDLSAIKGDQEKTCKDMLNAVQAKVVEQARQQAEKMNLEIERGMAVELARLQDVNKLMTEKLTSIELTFRKDKEATPAGVDLVAGAISSGLGGLFGSFVGGAFSGFNVAGLKGAAVGGVSGAAVTTGAAVGLLITASLIGLPLTWPVTLPALAISGLIGTFSSKKLTGFIFGGEQVEKFREAFRVQLLAELEGLTQVQALEMRQALKTQINEGFMAVRERVVNQELGGSIETTQRTLNDLRTQQTRSSVEHELHLEELKAMEQHAQEVGAFIQQLLEQLQLHRLQPGEAS